MKRLRDLRSDVRQRLGDLTAVIWSDEEIDLQLVNAYQQIAQQDVFFDFVYLENLPAVASYNQAWEAAYLPNALLTVLTYAAAGCTYTHPWEQGAALRNGFTDLGYADHTARWEADHLPVPFVSQQLSQTQTWETTYWGDAGVTAVTGGTACFTADWEFQYCGAAHLNITTPTGPACYTNAFENADAKLIVLGLIGALRATFDPLLPPYACYTNAFEVTDGDLTKLGLQSLRPQPRLVRGGVDGGHANTTGSFEVALGVDVADERTWTGPAVANHRFEVTETFLSRSGADPSIPATADVPASLTQINRITWDRRGIDVLDPRIMQQVDSRYELTAGEVYGIMWKKDGLRTVRKVRVPGQPSDSIALTDGLYGVMRSCADLTGDPVTGTWGSARRIPSHHPIGGGTYGTGRRPYLEGKNVRLEHFRQGQPLDDDNSICELPDRYALYLRDYAQSKLLARNGPGQDLTLAAHFLQRWTRGLARITRRRQLVNVEHTIIIGGEDRGLARRPPRPSLPWPYGREVR